MQQKVRTTKSRKFIYSLGIAMTQHGLVPSGSGEEIPLKDIQIRPHIQGYICNVVCHMQYENEKDNPIEAKFTFPVDDQSAVYRFEAEIDGRLIIAECQDKDQAEETYEDAIQTGHSAFLMKESDASADVFECLLGNIPTAGKVKVTFAYVCELNLEGDGAVKFVWPAVLGNRYGSPDRQDTSSASTSGRSSKRGSIPKWRTAKNLPYSVSFEAVVESKHQIIEIKSEEERLDIKYMQRRCRAQVMLQEPYLFDHDLVLLVWYEDPYQPCMLLERGHPNLSSVMSQDVVMLNFCPQLTSSTAADCKGEYVFIIDRSGSMMGDRIDSAKKALGQFLDNLPDDCYFNVISFGSTLSALFASGSVKKTAAHLKRARTLQSTMLADMGGTAMMPPFELVYSQPLIPQYPKQILVLTDGNIWDVQRLVTLVKKNSKHTRVFSFGIGHGVSTSLVKRLARAGRGKAEFITDDLSRLPVKVVRVMRLASQPFAEDVTLQWNTPPGVKVHNFPATLPSVFIGERLIVYGIVSRDNNASESSLGSHMKAGTIKASLTASVGGSKIKHHLAIKIEGRVSLNHPMHRLAAKAQIKELEDDEDSSSGQKDLITLLSSCANVISKYTAFVGVDREATEKVKGSMTSVDIPTAERSAVRKKFQTKGSSFAHHVGVTFCGGGSADAVETRDRLARKMINQMPGILAAGNNISIRYQGKKRRKSGRNFTQKKSRKSYKAFGDVMFAPWADGHYYPISNHSCKSVQRLEVIFQDGCSRSMLYSHLVCGALIGSGDEVKVRLRGTKYSTAIVLEYCPDRDQVKCAFLDGQLVWVHCEELMLPRTTVLQMQDRLEGDFSPTSLCEFPAPSLGNMTLTLTTSDLAELGPDGWINENLVLLFQHYLQKEVMTKEQISAAHFFPPCAFNPTPSNFANNKRVTRQRNMDNSSTFASMITKISDFKITGKKMLFFPVYEIGHWFVIIVRLYEKSQCELSVSFSVADSYYNSLRNEEITLIKSVLTKLCQTEGVHVQFDARVHLPMMPVQSNEADCGICMFLAMLNSIKEGHGRNCSRTWWDVNDPQLLRQQLSALILFSWQQNNSSTSLL